MAHEHALFTDVPWCVRTDRHPSRMEFLVEAMGLIPYWLSAADPRPAISQLDANYSQGGGWENLPGCTLLDGQDLKYPGDPPLPPLGECDVHGETVRVYNYGLVCVVHKDRSISVARLD